MRNEHPDFPDCISILGCDDPNDSGDAGASGGGCTSRYIDSRGISRRTVLDAGAGVWRFWHEWPGFSQRFTGTFSADGNIIVGVAELNQDGAAWEEDLRITYMRVT